MSGDLLQCYNKGCGNKYDPASNKENSCQYHPGVPVFHDALKGWSCCKRRSTDFTEFLNTPGCTKGLHSNVKPPEPEKPKQEVTIPEEMPKPIKKIEPLLPEDIPSPDEPLIRLPINVGATLNTALEKLKLESKPVTENDKSASDTSAIVVGTSCKNSGCTERYADERSNTDECVYHPGVPIFHEGMKYWSCCQRKTSDFGAFLEQKGCSSGRHMWKKVEAENKVSVRCDWHQTASFVTISIFCKTSLPTESFFEANKVKLCAKVAFDGGKSIFEKVFMLNGIVDPLKSNVQMLGSKVEINLRKSTIGSWRALEKKMELETLNGGSELNNELENVST